MNTPNRHPRRQTGYLLLEVLISILIFSVGVLAIVSLQGTSIKSVTDAQYRTEASLLANELIGQMWASNRAALANFSSPNGASYLSWVGNASTPGSVLAVLPGAGANRPQVVITALATGNTPKTQVAITLWWQPPGEDTTVHRYDAITEISQ